MSAVSNYRKLIGLTLIEVLIALAIVSIAMTAIIKATAQNIRSTHYLEQKTVAAWVGQTVLNRARVGVLRLPYPPDKQRETQTILGQEWYWQGWQEKTPNAHIAHYFVTVSATKNDDDTSLVQLETYDYKQSVKAKPHAEE